LHSSNVNAFVRFSFYFLDFHPSCAARVVAEKENDPWGVTKIDGPPMLPIPDGGSGHANLHCDIFLVQTKLETAPAPVVAEGDGFLGKFWRYWKFQLNFDFVS
jgi:hypothetical protein